MKSQCKPGKQIGEMILAQFRNLLGISNPTSGLLLLSSFCIGPHTADTEKTRNLETVVNFRSLREERSRMNKKFLTSRSRPDID